MEKDNQKKEDDGSVIEFLAVYGWAILVVISAIGALIYFGVIDMPDKNILNTTNTTPNNGSNFETNTSEVAVPFYQRILLIVDYDKTLCPDLAILKDNKTIPITQVLNVTPEINFAKLGVYDTNKKNQTIPFKFINDNSTQCVSRYFLITNNDFIKMLVELGVPLANETQNN